MISSRIKKLKNDIVATFGKNLRSVLLYGSTTQEETETNDTDIIIILKNKEAVPTDIENLKNILGPEHQNIDAQLLYEKEMAGGNAFSLDTHGPFIIDELKLAVPIYGDNPFLDFLLYSEIRQASILQKLQYYTFRARQASLGYVVSTKDKSSDFHRKKLLMAMRDLLLAKWGVAVHPRNILSVFLESYPNSITSKFESLLIASTPLDASQALPIYETLYDIALSWAKNLFPEKRKPGIAKEDDIFFEYLLPKETSNIPFVILCEGLPSPPYQRPLMNLLVGRGFGVLYPRYRGTWESAGTFLAEQPSTDVARLAKRLREGMVLEKTRVSAKRITLLATSFGGAVALSLAGNNDIKRIVALSPVLDFPTFSENDSLKNFLQTMYPGGYRFTDETWTRLVDGSAVPSASAVNEISARKISLFGGERDKEVPAEKLQLWAKKYDIPIVIYSDLSHLSFSKLEGAVLDDVINAL